MEMDPILGSRHYQEFWNVGCSSTRYLYAKRNASNIQNFNHEHPDMPLQKRPRTQYTTRTPVNQSPVPFNQQNEAQFQNPNLVVQSLNYALPVQQGQAAVINPVRPYLVPAAKAEQTPIPVGNIPSQDGPLPIQPTSLAPISSQTTLNQQIINSFLEELFSLSNKQSSQTMPKQPVVEDPIGLDFDPAKLKVRHESVISALYGDLPRQCATCGMRFKTQEEHSHHMDWHLRKNRAAKKSSKQMLSRKFFPTSGMLLKVAETNETNPGPAFFPTGIAEEKNNFEEILAVLADEDQKECPLCMDVFDEYFSNETNNWMYRGAVYLNETEGSTRRLYKSLIGRIVHAKCIYTKEEIQSISVSS